jgi:cell division protein FtsL
MLRRKLEMKFVLVKKALVIILISTVFIAGLSTVYAGNIFNDNQEYKNEINTLIHRIFYQKKNARSLTFYLA